MSFGDPPDEVHRDNRTRAAVAFTRKFIKDHHSITDEDFFKLRTIFSEEELSALCAYISFIGGANKFGAVVGLGGKDAVSFNGAMRKRNRN